MEIDIKVPTTQGLETVIKLNVTSVKITIEDALRKYQEEAPFFDIGKVDETSHIGNLLRTWRHLENITLGCHVDYPRIPSWYKPKTER